MSDSKMFSYTVKFTFNESAKATIDELTQRFTDGLVKATAVSGGLFGYGISRNEEEQIDIANDPAIGHVTAIQVMTYLIGKGWKPIEHPKKTIKVFQAPVLDDSGDPINTPIPISPDFKDVSKSLAVTIKLAATIEDRSPVSVLAEILKDKK
jgi:hypothetical protein